MPYSSIFPMLKKIIHIAMSGAMLCLAHALSALSVIPPTFDELVQKADCVLQTEVVSSKAEWTGEGSNRHIVTLVKVRVEACVVGEAPQEMELRFFGGQVGDEGMVISGMPSFAVGDHDILFVRNNGKSFCPLVHVGHGRYYIVRSQANGSSFVARSDGTPLRETADVAKALDDHAALSAKVDEAAFMSLDAFKTAIVQSALAQGKPVNRQTK